MLKKIAFVALDGCFGCSFISSGLNDNLKEFISSFEIVSSPFIDSVNFDSCDICIIEGAVNSEESKQKAISLREKSKYVVALGTCACFGGINGLRNLCNTKEDVYQKYFNGKKSYEFKEVSVLLDKVLALENVIKVDYTIPGCPPVEEFIKQSIKTIAEGKSIKLPSHNLCYECTRNHESMLIPKREFLNVSISSIMEADNIDDNKCFLEQEILCMGPATRQGCNSRCVNVNVPCKGCMGPTSNTDEQGLKMINALSSILPAGVLNYFEDLIGTGYRFSLSLSAISKKGKRRDER